MYKFPLIGFAVLIFASAGFGETYPPPVDMIRQAMTEPYDDQEAAKALFKTVFDPATDGQTSVSAMTQYLKVGIRPELVLAILSLDKADTKTNGWGGQDLPSKLFRATSPAKNGEAFELTLMPYLQELNGYHYHLRLLLERMARWYVESSEPTQAKLADIIGDPSHHYLDRTSYLTGKIRKAFLTAVLNDFHTGFESLLLKLSFILEHIELNPSMDGWLVPRLAEMASDQKLDGIFQDRPDLKFQTRETIIESLGKVFPRGATLPPVITEALQNPQLEMRAAALRSAGDILTDEEAHQNLLEKTVQDPDSYIRWLSFYQMSRLKNLRPDLQEKILTMIRSAPPTVDINNKSEAENVAYGFYRNAWKNDAFAKTLIIEGLKSKSSEIAEYSLWAMNDWHKHSPEIQMALVKAVNSGSIEDSDLPLAKGLLRDQGFEIVKNFKTLDLTTPVNKLLFENLKEAAQRECVHSLANI